MRDGIHKGKSQNADYSLGYSEGFYDGESIGYDSGHYDSYEAIEGYLNEGYDSDIYDRGYDDGYEDGYESGKSKRIFSRGLHEIGEFLFSGAVFIFAAIMALYLLWLLIASLVEKIKK